MCVRVFVDACVCLYVCVHTNARTTPAHVCMCVHMYMYTCTHTCAYMYLRIYMYTHICLFVYIFMICMYDLLMNAAQAYKEIE